MQCITVFDQCSMTLQIYHRQCLYDITDISLTVGVQCSITLEIYLTQCLINAVYYSVWSMQYDTTDISQTVFDQCIIAVQICPYLINAVCHYLYIIDSVYSYRYVCHCLIHCKCSLTLKICMFQSFINALWHSKYRSITDSVWKVKYDTTNMAQCLINAVLHYR